MKNIFQLLRCGGFLFVVFCLFIATNPLYAQWIQTNGPYGGRVRCFAVSGTDLFAGTWGGGVWRRPLSEMITAVEALSTDLPTNCSLDQNYPNPFNPTTIIAYDIPNTSHVTLVIYDILGRQVAQLVNGERTPGRYQATFNPGGLPSGVYFYKLQAGAYHDTKKLLLLK